MGAGDFGDFIRQVPLTILFAPICFGAIYIVLMVFVFRRAAERRRRKQAAQMGQMPAPAPQPEAVSPAKVSPLAFLRGQLPNQPLEPAPWTVPAALRAVPEPDLDLLAAPVSRGETPSYSSAQAQPAPAMGGSVPAPEPDWVGMVTPVAPQQPTAAPAPISIPDNVVVPGDAVEVMRAWRDLSDGSLIVQMGDQRYRSLAEIQSADIARRFTALVREFNTMAGGSQNRGTNTMPTVSDPGMVIPPPSTSTGGMKSRLGVLQAAEPEPPKQGIIQSMTRGRKKDEAKAPPPQSIADAVEEFLQYKLTNTPEFAARSIHIRPTPDHGLRIEVEGHYYEAITDVVDPDVREFLLGMMREWEARQ